jgi:hypothetical protein
MSELDGCDISEVVEYPLSNTSEWDNPPFLPTNSSVNSGYLSGADLPLDDSHSYSAWSITNGPTGKFIAKQLAKYRCNRCGAVDMVVPNSGFNIHHQLTQSSAQWIHATTKYPATISIGALSSGPGNGNAPSLLHNIP